MLVESKGEVLFSPMLFKDEDLDLSILDKEVPLDQLIRLGKVAT